MLHYPKDIERVQDAIDFALLDSRIANGCDTRLRGQRGRRTTAGIPAEFSRAEPDDREDIDHAKVLRDYGEKARKDAESQLRFDPVAFNTGDEFTYRRNEEQPSRVRLYRGFLEDKYGSVKRLNRVWEAQYASFDEVFPLLDAGKLASRATCEVTSRLRSLSVTTLPCITTSKPDRAGSTETSRAPISAALIDAQSASSTPDSSRASVSAR